MPDMSGRDETLFEGVSADQITNGEHFMMSTKEDARQTIEIMKEYCRDHDENTEKLTIADAFACLGGNTHSFAENFNEVVAYEIDEKRYTALVENVKYRRNVTVKWQDCTTPGGILNKYYDVVFLDPPWVNPATNKVDGKVFERALELCTQISEEQTAKYVFLKLPLESNFPADFQKLHEGISDHWDDIQSKIISRFNRHGSRSVYTIVCACRKGTSAAHTHGAKTRMREEAHLSALLTQLRACQFF